MSDPWTNVPISITLEDGRVVSGHYTSAQGLVTVRTFLGTKTTQLGGFRNPKVLALLLLRQLAEEGKA